MKITNNSVNRGNLKSVCRIFVFSVDIVQKYVRIIHLRGVITEAMEYE
jgi:hypothetical protein